MSFRKYTSMHQMIVDACQISETFTQVEFILGLSTPNTRLRKYIQMHHIPMPLYLGRSAGNKFRKKYTKLDLSDLKSNTLLNNNSVKKLLFQTGVKEEKCEVCQWSEARPSDGKIPLHLHHINGDNQDYTIENLQILCPNHHSLTENYSGLNKMRLLTKAKPLLRFDEPKNNCMFCGEMCHVRFCSRACYHLYQRKCERPSKNTLCEEITTLTWRAIGEKYGVSDNAVRKWARQYGII